MFELSSRAESVSPDSIQVIKSANQTVDVTVTVTAADDSVFAWGSVCRQGCQAAIGSDVWYHEFSAELKSLTQSEASRYQLSQRRGEPVHVVCNSLTHTSNNCRTPADPHTHRNDKNTHLTLFWRCKYHQKQAHKHARSDSKIKWGSAATRCHFSVVLCARKYWTHHFIYPLDMPSVTRPSLMDDSWVKGEDEWMKRLGVAKWEHKTGGMSRCLHGVWFTAQGHTWEDSSNNNNNRFEAQVGNYREKHNWMLWKQSLWYAEWNDGWCAVQSNWNLSLLTIENRRNWDFIMIHSCQNCITTDSQISICTFFISCFLCFLVKLLHTGDFGEKWVGGLLYSSWPDVLFSCIFTSLSANSYKQTSVPPECR